MWSAQGARELKIDHAEPEERNSAVGWHWNIHSVPRLKVQNPEL